MVGLLFALPNTQLSRRLLKEGRLKEGSEVVSAIAGDQCLTGLNFETLRDKREILADFKKIISDAYDPKKYFARVLKFLLMMDCSKKQLNLPLQKRISDLRGFSRVVHQMGVLAPYRHLFWKVLLTTAAKNPKAIRYAVALMALYLHFGPFKDYVLTRMIDNELRLPPSKQKQAKIPPKQKPTESMHADT